MIFLSDTPNSQHGYVPLPALFHLYRCTVEPLSFHRNSAPHRAAAYRIASPANQPLRGPPTNQTRGVADLEFTLTATVRVYCDVLD